MKDTLQHPENWICIGRFAKPLALKGALTFSSNIDLPQRKLKELDILLNGEFRRLQIQSIREHSRGLQVQFKEITDRNQSESLQGAHLFGSPDLFVSAPGESIYLREILGFEVLDLSHNQNLGRIESISSNGPQDLLVVGEKSILTPFVDAFIVEVDFPNRTIRMNLPEGLY